eukprot:m.101788 g.101788  ORF g.101788 m.101788 type:complete len:381 (+) comp14987_c0_seq1:108-1250(+)
MDRETEASEYRTIEVAVDPSVRSSPLQVLRHNVEESDAVSAHLFDEEYTVAAATGFTIWPGSRVMMDFFANSPHLSHNSSTISSNIKQQGEQQGEEQGQGQGQEQGKEHAEQQGEEQGEQTGDDESQAEEQLQVTQDDEHLFIAELSKESRDAVNGLRGAGLRGMRVVELGSGIGLLGLYLASLGAHVLMTDVRPVVEDILTINTHRNQDQEGSDASDSHARKNEDMESQIAKAQAVTASAPWLNSVCISQKTQGTATCMTLDWTRDLDAQATSILPWDADLILAAETIWLKELIDPFVNTVKGLLDRAAASGRYQTQCLLCYTNRGKSTSSTFAVTDEVLKCFQERGCSVARVHSQIIDKDTPGQEPKRCTIYRVALTQ